MPGIISLVNLISLDVTDKLVAAGVSFDPPTGVLAVTGATNASPIVVTVNQPHLMIQKGSVVVAGVLGNTAANGVWYAQVIDDTHLALYSISPIGQLVNSAGNGAYTSGGTVKRSFVDGGIVVGQVHVEENIDAPRCIFIPKRSRFGARSTTNAQSMSQQNALAQAAGIRSYTVVAEGSGYLSGDTVMIGPPDMTGVTATATLVVDAAGHILKILPQTSGSGYRVAPVVAITSSTGSGAVITANLDRIPEQLRQLQQRALWTDYITFEVQVWQAASSPSYENDFDTCQTVYQQVMATSHLLASGQVEIKDGQWMESQPNTTQMVLRAHVYKFMLEFATPILDQAVLFANPPIRGSLTLQMGNSNINPQDLTS